MPVHAGDPAIFVLVSALSEESQNAVVRVRRVVLVPFVAFGRGCDTSRDVATCLIAFRVRMDLVHFGQPLLLLVPCFRTQIQPHVMQKRKQVLIINRSFANPNSTPSECDDVITKPHVSRSRGLPHREVADGLRRPLLESINDLEQILGC